MLENTVVCLWNMDLMREVAVRRLRNEREIDRPPRKGGNVEIKINGNGLDFFLAFLCARLTPAHRVILGGMGRGGIHLGPRGGRESTAIDLAETDPHWSNNSARFRFQERPLAGVPCILRLGFGLGFGFGELSRVWILHG